MSKVQNMRASTHTHMCTHAHTHTLHHLKHIKILKFCILANLRWLQVLNHHLFYVFKKLQVLNHHWDPDTKFNLFTRNSHHQTKFACKRISSSEKHSYFNCMSLHSDLYQATKQHLNGEKQWKMRRRAKPLICFWLSYVVFLSKLTEKQHSWTKKRPVA